jgi:hypothetical protein
LPKLAAQAQDTVVMNESTSAAPTAVVMPTCTTGADLYNTSTHSWSCVATGGGTPQSIFSNLSSGQLNSPALSPTPNQANFGITYIPSITFSAIAIEVQTLDASGSDFYSWGIYSYAAAGGTANHLCTVTAVALTSTGWVNGSCMEGTVTLAGGEYTIVFAGNASTAKIFTGSYLGVPYSSSQITTPVTAGQVPTSVVLTSAGLSSTLYSAAEFILH